MKKQIIYLPVLALGLLAGCGESIDTSKELKTSEDSFSYVYGYETAQRMKQQGIDGIDFGSFLRGVKDGLAKDLGVSMSHPGEVMDVFRNALKRYPRGGNFSAT